MFVCEKEIVSSLPLSQMKNPSLTACPIHDPGAQYKELNFSLATPSPPWATCVETLASRELAGLN